MSHWIQKAIKHPGVEKKAAAKAGESTHEYMEKHKDSSGKAGKRARLGLELSKMNKEDIDTIITSAFNNKPGEFLDAFSNIMSGKMVERVAARKLDIAQSVYKPDDIAAAETEEEEPEVTDEGEVVKIPANQKKEKTSWKSKAEYEADKADKGKVLPFKKKD